MAGNGQTRLGRHRWKWRLVRSRGQGNLAAVQDAVTSLFLCSCEWGAVGVRLLEEVTMAISVGPGTVLA